MMAIGMAGWSALAMASGALPQEDVLNRLRAHQALHAVQGPVACGPQAESQALCPAGETVLAGGHAWVQSPSAQGPAQSFPARPAEGWVTRNAATALAGSCQRAVAQCATLAALSDVLVPPMPQQRAYAYEVREVRDAEHVRHITSGLVTMIEGQPVPFSFARTDNYGRFHVTSGVDGELVTKSGTGQLAYRFHAVAPITVPARFAVPGQPTTPAPQAKGQLDLAVGQSQTIVLPQSDYEIQVKRYW